MRLDATRVARIRSAAAQLPARRYDSKLPRRMQRDPAEYERRLARRE